VASYSEILGSIMRFIYDTYPIKIYEQNLPTEVEVPSVFYPPIQSTGDFFTKDAYNSIYIVRAVIIETDSKAATQKAETIVKKIREKKFTIPKINQDGTMSQEKVFFRNSDYITEDNISTITMTVEVISNFI
jgi:hypothetical protein